MLQKQYYNFSVHKKIHLQSKRSVYVDIFLRLLLVLPCHSWELLY